MFLATRFHLFQFGCPQCVVEIFAKEVATGRNDQIQNEEDNALWHVKNLEYWVHPSTGYLFDDVNPNEIGGHEDRQSG